MASKKAPKLKIVYRKIADLQRYEANARYHSDEQVRRIAASMREFGFNVPILLDPEDKIIAGHGRLDAAELNGYEEAPPHADFVASNRSIDATMVDSGSHPCPTITTGENKGTGYVEAEASMSGYATGAEWDKFGPGEKSSKYFQLVKPALDEACPTITAAGGNPGLASVYHPLEKRKFSIAELKRICGFPDDFDLRGSYQQQWERCGRAVPPQMMHEIAKTVRDKILIPLRDNGKI